MLYTKCMFDFGTSQLSESHTRIILAPTCLATDVVRSGRHFVSLIGIESTMD